MLDKQLEIASKNLALNDSILNIIQLLQRSGDVTALAVQQAEAQRQSTALLIPQLQQEISIQENVLQTLTGNLPGIIKRAGKLGGPIFGKKLSAGLPAALLSRRPDVRAAELSVVVANAQVGIAKAQMYPALNIIAGGGIESFQFNNWFNIPNSLFGIATGVIAQPVFNRRRLRTDYNVAMLQGSRK